MTNESCSEMDFIKYRVARATTRILDEHLHIGNQLCDKSLCKLFLYMRNQTNTRLSNSDIENLKKKFMC